MIQQEEAQELINKFINLRQVSADSKSKKDKRTFAEHEKLCVNKFTYLVTMSTSKYKKFNNYEDLNQEGLEALTKAMKNYNPSLGSFFWWAHRYIKTKISRSANRHTTIRFPLKYSKDNIPHKETLMPTQIDDVHCPDKKLEKLQLFNAINESASLLSLQQREVISLVFGLDGDKPASINQVCRKFNISRSECLKMIKNSLSVMKNNIKM